MYPKLFIKRFTVIQLNIALRDLLAFTIEDSEIFAPSPMMTSKKTIEMFHV